MFTKFKNEHMYGYPFWNPRSGTVGGIIMGVVVSAALVTIFFLSF